LRFDLADLRLFAAIAERGSITGGAAALNLALASASQRVSGMEAVLGVPLLERARRGVRPTEAGLVLLRHARDLLAGAERMRGELRFFSRGLRDRVRLLSNTGALLGFLPPVLESFLLAHPGLDIALAERPSPEIVRILADGAAALATVPLTDAWARRRLALCLRAPEDLTPHARLLVDHIRAATTPLP
jgi:molybdate transport repressor ModE-like protein